MEASFRDPGVADGERAAYRGLIDGEVVGEGVMVVEHAVLDEIPHYRQRLEFNVQGSASYEAEMLWRRRRERIVISSYELETRHEGELVAAERGRFQGVEALHWGGKLVPFPRDTAPLLGCALALRGLEFERGEKRRLSLWFANTVYWDMEVRIEKRERVSVPAGDIDAWRARARPMFGHVAGPLDKVIQMVLPPFRLHLGAEPPHPFLRFEFPTGPFPWNPRARIEATALG
jgi:hypothetical protein